MRRGYRRRRATGCGRTCRRPARHRQIRSCSYLMVVLRLRVHPAALPVVGSEPFLEIEEPQPRPWHYPLVESHPRLPFVVLRQIKTQPGRFLLIEMRNAPAAGKRVQIRTVDEDL